MNKIERKLQKVIYAFIMSVIIIVAAFAVTIYYYETKEISKAAMGEGLFAKAFVDENVGSAPLNVSFSSLLFNFEGTPTYHWDFGDGNASNEISPIHNYTEKGEYTCNLTITDITGESVTASVNILVVANQPPSVTALILPSTSGRELKGPLAYALAFGPENLRVSYGDKIVYRLLETSKTSKPPSLLETPGWITCEAQVSDPEGDEIVSYEWELKQQPITILGQRIWPSYSFTGKNITIPLWYTFRRGWYDIILTVTDATGNEASEIKKIQISESDLEIQRNIIKNVWEGMWGPDFKYQKNFVKNILHPLMWKMLGPIHNLTDNMVKKILAPLPPDLRDSIYSLYYTIAWDKTDKEYHRPNWNPPNIPSDPSPTDNDTGVGLDANLSWNCSDPDGDTMLYDIYFGQTLPPPLVGLDQKSTTYALIAMQSNTTYYWNIVAKDRPTTGESETTYGPLWSFTTT